jgi:hypothetical protein
MLYEDAPHRILAGVGRPGGAGGYGMLTHFLIIYSNNLDYNYYVQLFTLFIIFNIVF